MIEIQNVCKAYGESRVVDEVNLTIPKGGLSAMIGPNGAGKSTLLSMIARLLPMTSGSIAVDGLDVVHTPSAQLARKLSVLRQENSLTMRLTVQDLVALGRFPYNQGRPTPEDHQRVEEALCFLGLQELGTRFLDQLSGGQRQRAFVAMVLCQDTEYLMLDEPLNNLDMRHAVDMMKLLRRLTDEKGKTVVIVLHDINFASIYADNIIALKEGRLLTQGTPEQLITTDVLRSIYNLEIPIHHSNGHRIANYYL